MTLNYVTLTLDLADGQGNTPTSGVAYFTPTTELVDTADHERTTLAPVPAVFRAGGPPAVSLLATDNDAPLPAGWAWQVTFSGVPASPFTFFLPFTSGADQYLSDQAPVSTAPATSPYLTVAGIPVEGQVPIATGAGQQAEWGNGGGGGGGNVDSVTAADASIVVGGTGTNPTVRTGTLDVIAAQHPAAAAWSNNSKKITSLANGTASGDAAAFGQIGTAVATETARAEAAEALLAPLASPVLTGTPTGPTASPGTDSTQLATTAYSDAAVTVETSRAETAEALKAPLASPALTGTPTAPTRSAGNNSTAVATTAYADAAVAVETSRAEGAEALLLPLAGGALTGPIAGRAFTLADASSIAVNASLGNIPRVTLGGNRTMAAPSSPVDTQVLSFEITQDGAGSRTLSWASGTGGYSFGSGSAPTLSTGAGATDLVSFRYRSAAQQWAYLGSLTGY